MGMTQVNHALFIYTTHYIPQLQMLHVYRRTRTHTEVSLCQMHRCGQDEEHFCILCGPAKYIDTRHLSITKK